MSSFSIGKKLYFGVGALVLFTFALGMTSYLGMSSISERVHTMVESISKKQALAHDLSLQNAELLSDVRGIVLRGFMKDPAAIEKCHESFNVTIEHMKADIESMRPLVHNPDAKQGLQDTNDSLQKTIESEKELDQSALAGDMTAAINANDTLLALHATETASIGRILAVQDALLVQDSQASLATIDRMRWIIELLLALACVITFLIGYVIRQINHILRGTVQELSCASEQIAAAAGQVSASSQSLASGSSQQAATIEETSSASSEINSMAQRTSVSSRETAEIVTRSQENVQATRHSLEEMVLAMEDINSSSQKISKIIKVIDEIAFQTNILALNAAVEAARAGEAGMGFAVVADEVRNLAQRCAQAARDTADLIDDSIQKSAGGKVKVDQVAVAIRAITGESARIKTLIDEISLGSVEQSRGIDQITQAISQMEQATQSSAANAEESAASAQQLSAQAASLKQVVDKLHSMVGGGARSAFHASTSPVPSLNFSRAKSVTSFRSNVKFPTVRPSSVPGRSDSKSSSARPAAVADFPLDDDFKEF